MNKTARSLVFLAALCRAEASTAEWTASRLDFLHELNNSPITTVRRTSDDSIWIESAGRVFRYDSVELTEHRVAWPEQSLAPVKRVSSFLETKDGKAYLFSISDGIFAKPANSSAFLPIVDPHQQDLEGAIARYRDIPELQLVLVTANDRLFQFSLADDSVMPVPVVLGGKAHSIALVLPFADGRVIALTKSDKAVVLRVVEGTFTVFDSFDCVINEVTDALPLGRDLFIVVNSLSEYFHLEISETGCVLSDPVGHVASVLEKTSFKEGTALHGEGAFAVATDLGLLIQENNRSYFFSRENTPLPTDEMVSVTEVSPGVVWAGSFLGPLELRRNGVQTVRKLGIEAEPSVVAVDSSAELGVFVATYSDLYREVDNNGGSFFVREPTPEGMPGISSISITSTHIWVGYQDGQFAYKENLAPFTICDNRVSNSSTASPITGVSSIERRGATRRVMISRLNGYLSLADGCSEIQVQPNYGQNEQPPSIYSIDTSDDGFWIFGSEGAKYFKVDSDNWHPDGLGSAPAVVISANSWSKASGNQPSFIFSPTGDVSRSSRNGDLQSLMNGMFSRGDTIFAVEVDRFGTLWLASLRGLWSFNDDENRLALVQSTASSQIFLDYGASHTTFDNRILFGGTGGLLIVNPPPPSNIKAEVRLEVAYIEVDDLRIPLIGVQPAKTVVLNRSSDSLSFLVKNMSFIDPVFVVLEHYLDGYDREWRQLRNDNKITYTNLPPGDYIFRARGIDSAGNRSVNEIAIPVHVAGPIWTTWWAFTIYAALFLLAGSLAKKLYDRHLVARAKLQFADEQAEALAQLEDDYQEQVEVNERILKARAPDSQHLLDVIGNALHAYEDAEGQPGHYSEKMTAVTGAVAAVERLGKRTSFDECCDTAEVTDELAAQWAAVHAGSQAIVLNDIQSNRIPIAHGRYIAAIIQELMSVALTRREYPQGVEPIVTISAAQPTEMEDGALLHRIQISDNALPAKEPDSLMDSLVLTNYLVEILGGALNQSIDRGNVVSVEIILPYPN